MLANTPQPVTTIEKRMAVARCQRSLSVAIVFSCLFIIIQHRYEIKNDTKICMTLWWIGI